MLKKRNIQIIHAETAQEAIELFEEYKDIITLILLDIKLPDKLGIEIVPDLLKIKNIPIVAQTSYTFEQQKEKAIESGCIDYIKKPITQEHIDNILKKYFFI